MVSSSEPSENQTLGFSVLQRFWPGLAFGVLGSNSRFIILVEPTSLLRNVTKITLCDQLRYDFS